jgi:hypothetical protein
MFKPLVPLELWNITPDTGNYTKTDNHNSLIWVARFLPITEKALQRLPHLSFTNTREVEVFALLHLAYLHYKANDTGVSETALYNAHSRRVKELRQSSTITVTEAYQYRKGAKTLHSWISATHAKMIANKLGLNVSQMVCGGGLRI